MEHKDASGFMVNLELNITKDLWFKEDITALLYICILFKLVVQFLSLYFGGTMCGIKTIIALLILGQFHASVKGKNEAIALSHPPYVCVCAFFCDFRVILTHLPFLYFVSLLFMGVISFFWFAFAVWRSVSLIKKLRSNTLIFTVWLCTAYSTIFLSCVGRSFSQQTDSPCSPSPCFNKGDCLARTSEEGFGYSCLCPEGFSGKRCEISK